MDVGTTTSQNLYSYQSAVAGGTQAQAIFQTLTKAYAQSSSALSATDGLSVLAGQANLKPLISAIYTQGKAIQAADAANGTDSTSASNATNAIAGLQSGSYGNLDASAASSLLTQLFGGGGDSSSTLQGFGVGLSSASSLASVAADARKAYGGGTLTSDAQAQAAATLKEASGTGTDTGTSNQNATYSVQAAVAAQLAAMNNTFTLLA
jgi:hypothetical protein